MQIKPSPKWYSHLGFCRIVPEKSHAWSFHHFQAEFSKNEFSQMPDSKYSRNSWLDNYSISSSRIWTLKRGNAPKPRASPDHRTSVKDCSRIFLYFAPTPDHSNLYMPSLFQREFIFSCQATHFLPSLQSNNVSWRKRKENDITIRVLFERKHDYIGFFVHFKVSVTVKQSNSWSPVKDSSIFDRGGIWGPFI